MPSKPKYTLEGLLAGITSENRHEEIDFGPPAGREFGGPFEGMPYNPISGDRTMQVKAKRVSGGYELFIPDELALRTGIAADVTLELDEMGDMLMVRQEEFVQAKRAAEWATFDRSKLHDPHEPYPLSPGMEPPTR